MYIDLHSDTVMHYIGEGSLYNGNSSKINFLDLLENKNRGQYMAIFMPSREHPEFIKYNDWDYFNIAAEKIEKSILEDERISHARNYNEYSKNLKDNKLSIFTSIEDGRIIEKLEDVDYLKSRGISMITLLWNNENKIGYPNSDDPTIMNRPLKDFGMEVVEELNSKKIIIDISHLNFGGAENVLNHSKAPVIASHSNSMAICNHRRNFPDELIVKLANKGGVMGLNICPAFVGENVDKKNILQNLEVHLKHILNIGGEDILSIGTDFDGIGEEELLPTPFEITNWLESLSKTFGATIVEKIAYKNFERVLKETT